MNILIIHDSEFGNTNMIAQAMLRGALKSNHTETLYIKEATPAKLKDYDVIVVGSPTQGGRPTQLVQQFINSLPRGVLRNKKVAAFDTRLAMEEHGRGLRILMRTIGFAAPKVLHALETKGGIPITKPIGFFVNDKEGPLREGEEARASKWLHDVSLLLSRSSHASVL